MQFALIRDHLAFLLQLCELELLERERKVAERRLKAARFPNHKSAGRARNRLHTTTETESSYRTGLSRRSGKVRQAAVPQSFVEGIQIRDLGDRNQEATTGIVLCFGSATSSRQHVARPSIRLPPFGLPRVTRASPPRW